MALRNIRKLGDDILRKKCRPVETIDERVITLLDDMAETMYEADGCGLAASQVGILRRYCIVDVGDGLNDVFHNVSPLHLPETTKRAPARVLSKKRTNARCRERDNPSHGTGNNALSFCLRDSASLSLAPSAPGLPGCLQSALHMRSL